MISEIPDFVPGQRSISASALNAMKDAIARNSNITTNQGQTTYRAATGIHQILNLNPTFFWARITGPPLGYAYPFQEQLETTPGAFSDLTGGRSGTTTETPAYEQNHSTSVPVNSIVQIWTAESGDYIFSFSGGGGGTKTSYLFENLQSPLVIPASTQNANLLWVDGPLPTLTTGKWLVGAYLVFTIATTGTGFVHVYILQGGFTSDVAQQINIRDALTGPIGRIALSLAGMLEVPPSGVLEILVDNQSTSSITVTSDVVFSGTPRFWATQL